MKKVPKLWAYGSEWKLRYHLQHPRRHRPPLLPLPLARRHRRPLSA